MISRHIISKKTKLQLFKESRNQCGICGSKEFLQLAHINPMSRGGENAPGNILVLCATCHMGVDGARITTETLSEIKRDWIEKGILGKERIISSWKVCAITD